MGASGASRAASGIGLVDCRTNGDGTSEIGVDQLGIVELGPAQIGIA